MLTKSLSVLRFVAPTFFLLISSFAFADVTVLEEIAEAERKISYIGVRLKVFGSRTFEETVIHKSSTDSYRKVLSILGEQKTLSDENDSERNSDNNERNRDRRRREFRWERQRSQFSTKELELIAKNYKLERHRDEKIAGHETDLLIIKPKYPGRPTKKVYFARKNSVILRVEDLDSAGVIRYMFVYTRISFERKVVNARFKDLQSKINSGPRRNLPEITLAEAEKVLTTKPIKPLFLPPGFQLQSVHKHQYRGSHPIQLKYTDGMLDINLYQTIDKGENRGDRNRGGESIKVGDVSVRKYRRGPTYAFNWSSSGIHYFLSSPLPATEMVKIIESIIDRKTVQK